MFRTLIILGATGLFLAAVVWLLPIEGILKARGYSDDEIAALQEARTSRSQSEESQPTTTASAPAPSSSAGLGPAPRPTDTGPAERESLAPRAGNSSGSTPRSNDNPKPKLIATDTINVRGGQGTNFAVVGKVYRDDSVAVVSDPGGDWLEIERGEVRGWVYRPLFRKP